MSTQTSNLPDRPENYLGWASSNSNGHSAEEFSNLLVSKAFWDKWESTSHLLNTEEAVQRAISTAKFEALEKVISIDDLPERSSVHMLLDAKKNGWYRFLPAEYSDLSGLMSGLVDKISEDNESSRRDIQYAVDHLFPALARAGVDVSKVIEIPKRWSKTRVAIPFIRQGIKDLSEEPEKLSEYLKGIIDIVVDNNISVREMRARLHDTGQKDHPTVSGTVYQTAPGKYMFVAFVDEDGLNWIAKILQLKVIDILQPLSKLVDLLRTII